MVLEEAVMRPRRWGEAKELGQGGKMRPGRRGEAGEVDRLDGSWPGRLC